MTELDIVLRSLAAVLAGGIVGLERTYHGRAAGIRTYGLVCFGAAVLVAVAGYVPPGQTAEQLNVRADISRVVQGLVTGIGFLGAGVIVKEGFTVRGLTTAAAVWVTAAIGVLIGLGHYWTTAAVTATTFALLSVARSIEERMPSQSYAHCEICFPRDAVMEEDALRDLVSRHGFHLTELSYKASADRDRFEYRMVLWSADSRASERLAKALRESPSVVDFRLSPSRD
jgi:putative Mg2+ transporter-C (MgtC) family protein